MIDEENGDGLGGEDRVKVPLIEPQIIYVPLNNEPLETVRR